MPRFNARFKKRLPGFRSMAQGGKAERIIMSWSFTAGWVTLLCAIVPSANLLARQSCCHGAPFATMVDDSEMTKQGPWLVNHPSSVNRSAQYSAVTQSSEDSNFWLGVFCFGDGRVFLGLSDTKDEIFPAQKGVFRFQMQFDGSASIPTKARYVNGHMIGIDPQSSVLLLAAMLHSQQTRILSLKVGQKNISRSFVVQPVSPALDQIIRVCVVRQQDKGIGGI